MTLNQSAKDFSADSVPPAQPRRPALVWLFTLYFGTFAGLLPVSRAVIDGATNGAVNVWIIFRLVIGAAVMFTCYQAWRGIDWGRVGMLWATTIYYAGNILFNLILFNNMRSILIAEDVAVGQTITAVQIAQQFLLACVAIWFCLRQPTLAWYRYDSESISAGS